MAGRVNPHPGILLYTRIKKSPYYYGARRHGVQLYSVYNHHYHPRLYRDPIEEYWQLLEGVTVWDVGGAERQVEISGPDAFRFANMLTPRNLERCAVGQCKYAFVTDERGGIINDPVLLRLGENHFWLSLADSDVLLWAKGVAYHAGMQVTITEPDVGPLQVQGPKSREVMTDLFGAEILELPYYHLVERELDGMRMVISRTGYSGELGYELYLRDASRDGVKLWDAVIQAGEPYGLAPIGPCHIRRIEGGILAHGCDMTIEENPYEVGYAYSWMVELEQRAGFHRPRRAARGRKARGHPQARRRRARRGAAGRLQRRLNARLLPRNEGRNADRQGHLGLLFTAAGEEHRLRDGPRRAQRTGWAADRRTPGRDGRRRRGRPRLLQARARQGGAVRRLELGRVT